MKMSMIMVLALFHQRIRCSGASPLKETWAWCSQKHQYQKKGVLRKVFENQVGGKTSPNPKGGARGKLILTLRQHQVMICMSALYCTLREEIFFTFCHVEHLVFIQFVSSRPNKYYTILFDKCNFIFIFPLLIAPFFSILLSKIERKH